MHDFKFKNKKLYCENIDVEYLARRFGTPLYVYSYSTLINHYLKLKDAFKSINPLICYSVKANSNMAIIESLINKGAGLDVVSGGELFRALKAGCPANRIVYASVGKTDNEIKEALNAGILFFNVESLPELENINRIARKLDKAARVAIRINPDVEAKTHKFITTGKITNKFGIDLNSAYNILLMRSKFSNIDISGLHIHIGSQITNGEPFVAAITKIIKFIGQLKKKGIGLEYLNIGGGLGIVYDKETPQTAMKFAKKALPLLKATGLKIIMEPGRFIVGNAGIMVTKVLYVKPTPKKKFIIVDAGMNDLIRPALYGAYHQILPLSLVSGRREKVDVVGPICESGDFFAKDRIMPKVSEGDYIAVMSAGAYGFTMASNYNSRRRACEILVSGTDVSVIRDRETYGDLIRNEKY
ncbi:MAG: diaminopimelate decarboxylase [Candidatus Omnitrophica bacterium CG_4_8_14_3_um_filter_43_15]|nr:MAG: diaminopimelate decarboxylase [Candidatus Omnitrophica bacterium CG1_02_43_210]PIV12521.1 MAG: diaminopimelate decarboxylase [Candidatus Omnitrophica bacterium CG03_land_8_20_14_0_80_43_22]PIW80238.1 MAG: diaminopimelate decarboxylase [Candidatus Omnitrophica bacterium CG_4_8_14_3_um_filter_43_15]PIY84270.1 MAG: diaminopimelate decarboxylase [Candidatus Omnitrophica bacterium CG_4_10_14_0_8_um_filter_43_18]PJC46222.1 MAG: diaminopimelate decarboxylase [Candidatus Omnitrophica bacterium 